MSHSIKTLYVIHHSHTDIGYTDLQERILASQVEHIRTAIEMSTLPENINFRWTCETLYCVEQFLKEADENEKQAFFKLARENRIGISGNYLNFTDLVDCTILEKRLGELAKTLKDEGIPMKTAMTADINGISMGQRDAMMNNGVEFLFTNIHTHHGMYPLYQNQNAYWWEAASGKKMLVWNGEHYNLGNALGLKPNPIVYGMDRNYFGGNWHDDAIETLHDHLEQYLNECEESGYKYDFLVTSVSGVFSDNAPPNDEIIRVIESYQKKHDNVINIQMVSLQELYTAIKDKLVDSPVFKGDLTDWWANGVGSTPLAVKHYRSADRMLRLATALSPETVAKHSNEVCTAEDNLLIYAEHTWGHSATITNPYETLVSDLDIRKTSYASKAHEAAATLRDRAIKALGGTFNYYAVDGKVRAVNTGNVTTVRPVEFYIETSSLKGISVTDKDGKPITTQLSSHPRGVLISFTDSFLPNETKEYSYNQASAPAVSVNKRHAYVGADSIRDIVNDFDAVTYKLPYVLENDWFCIRYEISAGFTSFFNKKTGCEMLKDGFAKFFTPIYELTTLRHNVYDERRRLGRNIRGQHAKQFAGVLSAIDTIDCGDVFVTMKFTFILEGTEHCELLLRMYHDIPQLDFTVRFAKKLSSEIESLYLPMTLNLPERELWLKKGSEPFRPGIDQIPGTCMEYWMSDLGIACNSDVGTVLLYTPDVPLFYQGELKHHEIVLCDGDVKNNKRDIYSWIMNNTWETNFRMDLSGFSEYSYRLELSDSKDASQAFNEMKQKENAIFAYIMK